MTPTLRSSACPLLCALLLTVTAVAQPARIVLLRHAEKPANELVDVHLSERGQQRARALTRWATNSPAWAIPEQQPAAVFACQPTAKAPSQRARETVTPLADQLQLPVQTPFSAKNPEALAKQILSDPALNGKTVVICWTHDELPQLAACLGVKSVPAKWRKNVFDRFWLITFPDSTGQLSDRPQKLLPDDSAK